MVLGTFPVIREEDGQILTYGPPDNLLSGLGPRGVLGINDILDADDTIQKFPLGTEVKIGDRLFRYAKAGGVALAVGKLMQMVVPIAGHIDEAVDVPVAGGLVVSFTPTSTNITADQYANGYLYVNDDTGEGYAYRVKSHPAITAAAAGNITLWEDIRLAFGAAATCTLVTSKYDAVIVHPSPPTAMVVGVPTRAITASRWFWMQIKGPVPILTDGTVVIGEYVVASDAVDGAVEPADAAITDGTPPTGHGEVPVGVCMAVNATTEYSLIDLRLE